jgi:hypothetical protein
MTRADPPIWAVIEDKFTVPAAAQIGTFRGSLA